MHETLRSEEAYIGRLTEKERIVYNCDDKMLAKLASQNDFHSSNFVSKARLLNSLHQQHTTYNELFEKYCMSNPPQAVEPDVDELLIDSMRMTLSVGNHAAVIDLTIMDDCDAVYALLAQLKMTAFDLLADNFDFDVLFDETVDTAEDPSMDRKYGCRSI